MIFDAQITITSEEIRNIRAWIDPIGLPILLWFFRLIIKQSRDALNSVITDNANRIKEELVIHIDAKFAAHEVLCLKK